MFRDLDELLRGKKTAPRQLQTDKLDLRLGTFLSLAVVLGGGYGFFMGWFAAFGQTPPNYMQLLASTLKLPALFLLTLVITFPSLYVFNALIGCRLSISATLKLLVAAVVVNVAVAASLGPILGFFTLSTDSYPFMIFLNVLLLALAGIVGLSFLLHTLRRLAVASREDQSPPPPREIETTADLEQGPLDPPGAEYAPEVLGQSQAIFRIWVIIYALVGAQMGWLLRPFIGTPDMKFSWFRERGGNFFQALIDHFLSLVGAE